MGRDGAEEHAARNSAMVTDYCYFASEDRIEVGVQLRTTGVDGAPARARAAASRTSGGRAELVAPGLLARVLVPDLVA